MEPRPPESASEHGVFSVRRKPVNLEADSGQRPKRRAPITIAATMLVIGLLSGLLYQRFWEQASNDPTRLIPASASAYFKGWRPIESIRKTMQLDRWARVEPEPSYLLPTGSLRQAADYSVAGLPYGMLLETAAGIDRFQIATVPQGNGTALLAFLRADALSQHRRALKWFSDGMMTADRQLGYDIHVLNRRDGFLPWAGPVLPLRMVAMEPFLLFTYGPESALVDVLDAKVGTVAQPIRTHRGFKTVSMAEPLLGGVRGYVDPGALFDTLTRSEENTGADFEAWRAAWANEIMAVSVTSEVGDLDEIGSATIHLEPGHGDGLALLRHVFRPTNHGLLNGVPQSAHWALSLGLDRPAQQSAIVERILSYLIRENDLGFDLGGSLQTLSALRTHVFRKMEARESRGFTGECVIAYLGPSLGWLIRAKARNTQLAESMMGGGLGDALGPLYSYGKITTDGGKWHHLLRPVGTNGSSDMAWRVKDGVIEFVTRRAAFKAIDDARASADTYAAGDLLVDAARSLHPQSVALFVLHPTHASWMRSDPLLALIGSALRPTFRFAASMTLDSKSLSIRTNAGLWTVTAALLTASERDLNAVTAPSLQPRCQQAFGDLCRRAPEARPCQPFELHRAELVRRGCARL